MSWTESDETHVPRDMFANTKLLLYVSWVRRNVFHRSRLFVVVAEMCSKIKHDRRERDYAIREHTWQTTHTNNRVGFWMQQQLVNVDRRRANATVIKTTHQLFIGDSSEREWNFWLRCPRYKSLFRSIHQNWKYYVYSYAMVLGIESYTFFASSKVLICVFIHNGLARILPCATTPHPPLYKTYF